MRSKSDEPIERINRNRVYRPAREAEFTGGTPINGFDTETADGDVFMITHAFDGESPECIHNNGKPLAADTVLNYLSHTRSRSAINVWYNLNFDANVLLKQILDERQMAKLTVGTSVEAHGYEIDFIPGKFLKLQDKHENVHYHFDVSQFFYAPLDDAANEWLGIGKLPDVDTSKFGKLIGPTQDGDRRVNDYIHREWFDVVKYAKRDAKITRDLWKEAVRLGEGHTDVDLSIPMGRPFSTGYMAESYLREHLNEKPGVGPTAAVSLAWEAMKGGRFETFERGDVGRVVGPDINSAYPAVLRNLPDPGTLDYRQTRDIEALQNADYGFVDVTVTTIDTKIQPFGVKMKTGENNTRTLCYPKLTNDRVQTILPIFLFALEQGLIKSYRIHEAWTANVVETTRFPFRDELDIGELYSQRKNLEADARLKAALLIKIVLNSMYGKTAQTTKKRSEVPEGRKLRRDEHLVPAHAVPDSLREGYEDGFVESLDAGGWWNPFLASYITGLTRLELHKKVVEHGLADDVVMFATDSLMVDADAFDRSTFAADEIESGLGNWDYDYRGRAFVVGSGVYEVERTDLDPVDFDSYGKLRSKITKTATRGFREADIPGLREAARNAVDSPDGIIPIESNRPITMAEAVWHGTGGLTDIGAFVDSERKLCADMDSKRDWERPATSYADLLSGRETSDPLDYTRETSDGGALAAALSD